MVGLFTKPGIWSGGFYEMSLYLGTPSEARVKKALEAIWSSPLLDGPYRARDAEPGEQQRVDATFGLEGHLYGTAKFPQGSEVPCGTFTLLECNENEERVADFVSLYIPLSALGLLFPVGAYPFGDHSAAAIWRPEVDAWFLGVLNGLGDGIQFEAGVIGWEPELEAADLEATKAASTAVERFDGVVLPTAGENIWYPPTRFDIISITE